ncbi:MAG: hypothetical protein ABI151_04165 [Chitinophagaceae bacterium]
MAARKTETRIPQGLLAADLGNAVQTSDNSCVLVSFIENPLVINRQNVWVLFTLDVSLAAAATSYEWTITEGGTASQVLTTTFGEIAYTPLRVGPFSIVVRILNNVAAELANLAMAQQVVQPSTDLEALIRTAVDTPGPSLPNPEVLRELINEYNIYYQNVTLQTPESSEGFKKFVFNIVFDAASQRKPADRQSHLSQLASSLNNGTAEFETLSTTAAGVAGIRPVLLAMALPGLLEWVLLPEDNNQRLVKMEELQRQVGALDENKKIDMYNIVRFPKSSITFCGRILELLRSKYFNTTPFDDMLTGMSGVRAQWILGQYQKGPIKRTA